MDGLKAIPAWLIALALILSFILILISYIEGKPLGYKITKDESHIGFIEMPKTPAMIDKSITLHGYFNFLKTDKDSNGKHITDTAYEPITLNYIDEFNFSASSESHFVKDGKKAVRKWIQSGYDTGSRMVISYISIEEKPRAAGIYFLKEDRGNFIGTWQGLDYENQLLTRCPYVLSSEEMDVSAAKSLWKNILEEKCKVIH